MSDDDHPILRAVGVAAVALGLLMVVQPGLAAAIGVDYAAVLLVGLIALVQAVRVARKRQHSEVRGAETADVETVETVPTPGEEFDETVATLRSGPRRKLIRDRADLRERVEEAAVTAVADRENCSPDEARERLEAGTWTDDPHAAAFLGGADAPLPSLYDRLKLAASPETRFQHRVRRTADAVARAAGVTPDAEDEASGERADDASDGGDRSASPGDGSVPVADTASTSTGSTSTGGTSGDDTGGTSPDDTSETAGDDGSPDAPATEDGRAEA